MALHMTEFHSLPRPAKAFNLLFLDQGEFLISSFPCRLTSPEYESEHGKLHLCSRSVLFQPGNSNLPLLRFKLSNADFRYNCVPANGLFRQKVGLNSLKESRPIEAPPSLQISLSRFEVLTRDPSSPRFTQPAHDSFGFEVSATELARIATEMELITSGEEEDQIAALIYAVRYKEFVSMLGDSEDFDPEEFLLHHKAKRLMGEGVQLGAFVLTQSSWHFYPLLNARPSEQLHVLFRGVHFAMRYTYLQEQIGVQIHTYASVFPLILLFDSEEKSENIFSYLQNRVKFRNPADDLPNMTDLWVKGHLSNFQYLICLNSLSGRTVLDLSQYPVFPWVLRNYHGEEIDLLDSANFRDLSKPMGALTAERLKRLQVRLKQTDQSHQSYIQNPLFHAFHCRFLPYETGSGADVAPTAGNYQSAKWLFHQYRSYFPASSFPRLRLPRANSRVLYKQSRDLCERRKPGFRPIRACGGRGTAAVGSGRPALWGNHAGSAGK